MQKELQGTLTQAAKLFTHGQVLPIGTRVLSNTTVRKRGSDGTEHINIKIKAGLPWGKEDFFLKSMQTQHPFNQESVLPDRTKIAIAEALSAGTDTWASKAKQVMKQWLKEGERSNSKEQALHEELRKRTPKVAAL